MSEEQTGYTPELEALAAAQRDAVQRLENMKRPPAPQPQKPSVGRIVHYTAYNGRCLAAIIIGVTPDSVAELVNLVIFTDMPNVVGNQAGGVQFHFGVASSEEPLPGYWHWPERV